MIDSQVDIACLCVISDMSVVAEGRISRTITPKTYIPIGAYLRDTMLMFG